MEGFEQTKILIVDDSNFSRTLIANFLREAKINHIFEANSAQVALNVMRENKIDVVITDVVMPEMSGIDLTRIISEKFPEVSTIVISSLSQDHIILEAIAAGASDFIAKPIDKNQLVEAIEKLISIER